MQDKMSSDGTSMHQLPSSTIRQIASAQVITSVVSAVKELVENSLDAGATSVEIKLENYGFDRLEVRDNGCGIRPVDTPYMAMPHYTSKISGSDDLEKLATYGFRGEALGSLSAVAELSITTKTAEDDVGFMYNLSHKGEITSSKPSHLGLGTTVTASRLFHNLPVRKQYYSSAKKKKEELRKVEDLVLAFSIICHRVRFLLKHNKEFIWQNNPVASPRDVLVRVFSSTVMSNMQHMTRKSVEEEMEIDVYLPKSSANASLVSRSNNDRCYVFVNQRPVIQKDVEKVVRQYFTHGVGCDSGRFPLAYIAITIPPDGVDVNLDPNKTKVMIHEKKEVMELMKSILDDIYGPLEAEEDDLSKSDTSRDVSKENLNNSFDSTSTTHSFMDVQTPDAKTHPPAKVKQKVSVGNEEKENTGPEPAWKANYVSAFDKKSGSSKEGYDDGDSNKVLVIENVEQMKSLGVSEDGLGAGMTNQTAGCQSRPSPDNITSIESLNTKKKKVPTATLR